MLFSGEIATVRIWTPRVWGCLLVLSLKGALSQPSVCLWRPLQLICQKNQVAKRTEEVKNVSLQNVRRAGAWGACYRIRQAWEICFRMGLTGEKLPWARVPRFKSHVDHCLAVWLGPIPLCAFVSPLVKWRGQLRYLPHKMRIQWVNSWEELIPVPDYSQQSINDFYLSIKLLLSSLCSRATTESDSCFPMGKVSLLSNNRIRYSVSGCDAW